MRALSGVFFAVLVTSSAGAQGDASDAAWAGTWTVNFAKSTVPPPAPTSETAQVVAPGGQAHPVTFTITGTNADGSPINVTFDGKADGNPYPMTSGGQEIAKAVLRRQSSHHYTLQESYSDGTQALDSLTISPDGKVATVRGHTTGPNGPSDVTEIWEKQP